MLRLSNIRIGTKLGVTSGIGILLVPMVVRRQAKKEVPSNMRMLKDALEQGGTQRS